MDVFILNGLGDGCVSKPYFWSRLGNGPQDIRVGVVDSLRRGTKRLIGSMHVYGHGLRVIMRPVFTHKVID